MPAKKRKKRSKLTVRKKAKNPKVQDRPASNLNKNWSKATMEGSTPLHQACKRGDVFALKELLQMGHGSVNKKDHAGYTPLMDCLANGNIECARIILEQPTHRSDRSIWKFATEFGLSHVLRGDESFRALGIPPEDLSTTSSGRTSESETVPDPVEGVKSKLRKRHPRLQHGQRSGPGDGASSSLHEHDPGAGNILDASKEHAADTDSTDQTRSDSLDNALFFMDRDLSYSAETAGQEEVNELVTLLNDPLVLTARTENPRLLLTFVTFFRLIKEKRLSVKFLPFLLFQDAVNQQNAVTADPAFTPAPPQKECAAFHALGVKQMGQSLHYFLAGNGKNLFHLPSLKSVSTFLEAETGIEQIYFPGHLPEMIRRAKEELGTETPLILSHDERKVKPGLQDGFGRAQYPGTELELEHNRFSAKHQSILNELKSLKKSSTLDEFQEVFEATSEVLPIYIERITEMMVTDEKHSNLLKKKIADLLSGARVNKPGNDNLGQFNYSLRKVTRKMDSTNGTLERSGNALRELGYVAYGPQTFFMLKNQENEESLNLRYLKQRTEKWFLAREDGAMSSSEIGAALNFYGLEKAKAIQEKIWKKNGVRIPGPRIITVRVSTSPLSQLNVTSLKEKLREFGLPLSGTKSILVDRLSSYLSSISSLSTSTELLTNEMVEELTFDVNALAKLKVCDLRKILSANGVESSSPKTDLINQIKEIYSDEDPVSVGCSNEGQVNTNVDSNVIDSQARENMKWGTDNEPNAVSTLVSFVIPALFKGLQFHEEGIAKIKHNDRPWLSSSGDGSLIKDGDIEYCVEIKCPANRRLPVRPPAGYICQMYVQAAAYRQFNRDLRLPKILFLSWTPTFTGVWTREVDEELLNEILSTLWEVFFNTENAALNQIQSKMPKVVNKLKTKLKMEADKFIRQGIFPSTVKSDKTVQESCLPSDSPYVEHRSVPFHAYSSIEISADITDLITTIQMTMDDLFNDSQEKATSVMIYTLSDATRRRNSYHTPYFLAMWYPCGSKQKVDTDREINYNMLNFLDGTEGLNTVACSFDAKSRDLMIKGMSREPLTIWGLQQRTLESMNGMTKADMRQELLERLTDRLEEEGASVPSLFSLCLAKVAGVDLQLISRQVEKEPFTLGYNRERERKKTLPTEGANDQTNRIGLLLTQATSFVKKLNYCQQKRVVAVGLKRGGGTIKKEKLRNALALLRFEDHYDQWSSGNPFNDHEVLNRFFNNEILYIPDTLSSGKRIVSETDFTHKMSRLRGFVQRGQVPGVNPSCWKRVAELTDDKGNSITNLTPVILAGTGADQMSLDHTRTFFSEEVAEEFRKMGHETEADFCRAVHLYMSAHDDRGISAEKRIEMMMGLYNYFRGMLTIPRFPLYGGKITCRAKDCGKDTSLCKRFCGMNFNLVEEILAGVQARVCLYLMTPSTGYAARAFGSIDTENIHMLLNHYDRRGVQCSSVAEVARQISTLQMLQIMRRNTKIAREMFVPSSSIYRTPEMGEGLTDCLFDREPGCGNKEKRKQVRPFNKHNPARGTLAIRALGGYKPNESNFQKL